jgi:UPF0176 protein
MNHPAASPIVNISAYKFVSIGRPDELVASLKTACASVDLKGTVLVAPEGINLFLAGSRQAIDTILEHVRSDPRFADLQAKESFSPTQPFAKMQVKQKQEIITMRRPLINPENQRAPAVDAATLATWLDRGHDDENRPVTLLDTRNDFEVDLGTFTNAQDLRLSKFSEFPARIENAANAYEGQTVVTFCTGGIRCEKAAIVMQDAGFERVYQLDGGILQYFERMGGKHYQGSCFVFDERRTLDPALQVVPAGGPTSTPPK